jgi:hypothetical protein
LVVPIGSPKYVNGIDSFLHQNKAASSLHLSSEIFIRTIDDLW